MDRKVRQILILTIASVGVVILFQDWLVPFAATLSPDYDPLGTYESYEPPSESFLRIEKWDCEPNGDRVIFTGRVRNTHDWRTLRWPTLRGRVENMRGTTLNNRTGVTDSDRIGPGDTSTFSFSVPDPSGTASDCFIGVEEAEFVR